MTLTVQYRDGYPVYKRWQFIPIKIYDEEAGEAIPINIINFENLEYPRTRIMFSDYLYYDGQGAPTGFPELSASGGGRYKKFLVGINNKGQIYFGTV